MAEKLSEKEEQAGMRRQPGYMDKSNRLSVNLPLMKQQNKINKK